MKFRIGESNSQNLHRLTYEKIKYLQKKKLNRLIKHYLSYQCYSVYCGFSDFQAESLAEFSACFPEMTKNFIKNNFNELKAKCKFAKTSSTSGSSGENFKFFLDFKARYAHSRSLKHFNKILNNKNSKLTIGIWGGDLKKEEEPIISFQKLKLKFMNTILLPGYLLDDGLSKKYIDIINIRNPDVLYGFPSYLYKIAKVGLFERKAIKSPKIIITSGEQLFDEQRQIIENYFNNRIYNRYGSCEFGVIGHELHDHNGLYVNPLQFIIETNSNNEILITDLDNYATPFIRYNIGDFGNISNSDKYLKINNIMGRANDVIETPSGKQIPSQFWTILSRTVGKVEQFQIVQEDKNRISMKVIYEGEIPEHIRKNIVSQFIKNYGTEMELRIEKVEKLRLTKYGKLKFVIKQKDSK